VRLFKQGVYLFTSCNVVQAVLAGI